MIGNIKRLALLLIPLLSFYSCIDVLNNAVSGNGNVITSQREIQSFRAIQASAGLNVYVTFGKAEKEVRIVADENLHQYIRTEVHGGLLKITSERSIRDAEARDVYVHAGEIKEIKVSGAARLTGKNLLKTDRLQVDVSSAGDLDMEIDAGSVVADVSSSGKAVLRGQTENLDADVSSAGRLEASELEARICDAEASSAGDLNIFVTGELTAEASSAGSIRYKGEPVRLHTETSSAGSILKK